MNDTPEYTGRVARNTIRARANYLGTNGLWERLPEAERLAIDVAILTYADNQSFSKRRCMHEAITAYLAVLKDATP